MRNLLRRTAEGGAVYIHTDEDDPNRFHVEQVFDREPLLDRNARMRNEVQQSSAGPVKIADIPESLFWKWLQEGKLGDQWVEGKAFIIDPRKLAAMLNDPEFQALKTVDARL